MKPVLLKTYATLKVQQKTMIGMLIRLSIGVGLALYFSSLNYLLLIPVCFGLSLIVALLSSKENTRIDFSPAESFTINSKEIAYKNIKGYYLSNDELLYNLLSIQLLSNQCIHLSSWKYGENGKAFWQAQEQFIEAIHSVNKQVRTLEYRDLYPARRAFKNQIGYALAGVFVGLNLLYLILLLNGNVPFHWILPIIDLAAWFKISRWIKEEE